MARVSILMNAYNAEKYLKEAIDSIYSQTFNNWEIIFVDNCSIDETKKIVDSYDNRIKYYKTKHNMPLGAARNFGLQHCNSEYIAFLDTDDIWLENKLDTQIKVMDEYKEYQLCYGGVIYIDQYGKDIGKLIPRAHSGNVFVQQLKRYEINMQSVLIKNSKNIKFNETLRHSPDFDLFIEIASKSKVYVIKDYLVKYRKLENSLTSKNIDIWWIEMKNTLDKIFLNDKSLKEKYPKGHELAYAKVAYYKARYLVSIGKQEEANKELARVKFTSKVYFILYLMSFFPNFIWNYIHKFK